MNSLAHNPQLQQYIQMHPNALSVGGANNLTSQLHTNYHGLPMGGGDPWGAAAGNPIPLSIQQHQKFAQLEDEKIYILITELTNPNNREQALLELSKKREQYDDLALILWHSFGVMTALLQEIVSAYPLLSPPTLSGPISNRRSISQYKTRPFEYLRLTSLGVIGALVKNDNPDVISFLLSTEIIPLCLRIMETGSELSKTVAIFIVQKILLDDIGLQYICATYERFYAVRTVLSNMVNQLVETQAVRLLKHVIKCYLRLSDNPRAREALRQCLPESLRDHTFAQALKDDITTKRCLNQLLLNLSENMPTN
ncbi:4622_t:CDS:2 [Entrophospora sp. SA101]|nr:6809_t:CDS:2 [Entrophospora sp. SA101]CAJ0763983.1 4622_t:CDS:2 [Entrophospora sp. SA101]CAJ0840208.1 16222_t:CDS:2 [Entrophospora sp. SA101]CAJ0850888.1 11797_t:CDS:2 [Entrophospora sp. SA101]